MVLKQFYKIISLTILVWLLNPTASRASHIMGSDLSYVCNGNNNYTVTLKIYRDCCGIDPGNSFSIDLFSGCTGVVINTFTATLTSGPTEVSQLCPAQLGQSACASNSNCPANPNGSPPTYPGVHMYTYQGNVTIPSACPNWYFRTNTCCRNGTINNIPNPASTGFGIEALVNNTIDPATGLPYCNTSVAFSTLPVPFVCINSLITYNNGAVDANGDSLYYQLINPLDDAYNSIPFTGSYSVTQPITTTPLNTFQFTDSTGQVEFTCPNQEVDVLAMQVNEYRNGVLVGTSIRDMQVSILPCTISIPYEDTISNVTNGFQSSQINVIVCPGTPLTFDIKCTDPANHSIILTSNINSVPSAIPGAQMVQVGSGDSVTAHITWTPLPGDTGCHDFILTAQNDDCPINGRYTRAYSICVFTKVQLVSASLTFCGTPVQLTASGGTNFTWTPSVGPNAVSNPLSYNPTVSPVAPTMYYFTSDCGTDSVLVNAAPPFVYDAGPGGTVCLNGQVNLNATTDNLYSPYTFQWVPSAGLFDPVSGLPNDTIPNPVASPLGSTLYKCYISGNNGCTNVDSLTVNISGAGPNIVAKAQPLVVCPGDLVNLNVVANPQSCGVSTTPCVGHVVVGQVGAGTGNTIATPTQYPTIYGHYQNSARHQFLYLQSELLAQLGSGGAIDSISFYMVHVNNNLDTLHNFEIKMACTQATSLPVEPNAIPPVLWCPNLVTVFSSKDVTLPITDGWITHKLDFPYDWDGTSNLVVDICSNTPYLHPPVPANKKMQMTPTAFNSVYYSSGPTSQCGVTGTPLVSTKRPNARFTVCVTDIDNLPISWTPNSGANAVVPDNIHNPVSHPETPVIYHVDVTALNGCHTQDYVYVDVDTSVQFHSFPDDTFFCSPHQINLTTVTTGSPLPGNSFVYEWRDLSNNSVVGNAATLSVTPNVSTDYLATLTGGSCVLHDTVHVVIGNNLPINLIIDSISCFGQTDGKIVAVAGGGTPPINYTWSNGPVIDSIQNLGAGTYTVSISDSQGCSGTAAATLSVPSQLTATSVAQNITCNGSNNGTITVTANGGAPTYSYLWNPSEPNAATISGLGVGNYLVTVTDSRGCTATSSASVTQPSSLVINTLSFNATTNGGNEGWAFTIANGGTPNYTYSWSTGSTNDTIQNLFAGTYYVTVCDGNGCCLFDTAVVTDPPPIQLTFVTVSNLCFGYCNGTSTVSATGGISPYTFVWSQGTNGNTVSNLCAAVYTVTATDSAGVTVSGNINITEPTQISIVLDTINITCFGANNGSVLATASGGTGAFTYNWNIGGAVNPNTNLGPGTYTVTATDANSCTAQSSWTAIEPPLLTVSISASTNVSCFGGNDGSATATVNGGTPTYTYAWSNIAATTNPASGFAANNQTVTVTDLNACTATASFVIAEPSQLTVSVTSVTNEICNGGTSGAIDITAAGGTVTYTYAWSNLATTEDLNGVVAGNYLVTVTDSKNCNATTTATISEPTAVTLSFTHTDPLCTGDATGTATVTANGGTPGYVYDWSVIPGANDNSTITNLVAGLYDVVVQDVNLCAAQGSVTLTNPPSLNAQLINKHEISCANAQDGSVEASVNGGTPPIGFVWSNSAITPIINNLAPGVYTVTVADNNGCDTVLNTSFTAPPLIDIAFLTIDSASCPQYSDASIHVEGTGGTPGIPVAYTYSTDGINFQSGELFENLSAGTYHLYIKDGQGCMKDTIVFVYEPVKPTLTILPQDSMIDLGKSITLVSNLSDYTAADINFYSWSPLTGLNCGECSSVVASPYTHTLYNLVINYLHDCSISQTVTVYVGNGDDIFVPNAFSPNGDGNNDVFTVYGSGLAKANLKIFNRWGEKVFDSQNQWLGWDGTYKGVVQNPGVYTYYLEGVYLNGKVKEKKGTVSLIR